LKKQLNRPSPGSNGHAHFSVQSVIETLSLRQGLGSKFRPSPVWRVPNDSSFEGQTLNFPGQKDGIEKAFCDA
jgi:hypothetical protein